MTTNTSIPGRPPRLERVFQGYEPFYFVTICTLDSKPVRQMDITHDAFIRYAEKNASLGRCVGRYVIMPDHVHFFVHMGNSRLGVFVRLLKQALSDAQGDSGLWQPGFFDHLMRHSDSYSEKWNYVYMNPVRAGLVERPEDWPFQGEVVRLMM